jgi:Flp pilus assembly protein TadG
MNKSESGQIIVILAVALVAILGITALAVDGSMIYAERREDQSTADSAALSAAQTASANPTCATARTAAINQAITYASAQEGVALVNDTTSPNRVEATCNADNSKLTVKIVVTSNTPTTFAKMVSRDQLTTTVESTSQVTFGGGTFAGGNGIVSTDTSNCSTSGGIEVGGGANNYIETVGGGIFSNNCIKVTGSSYVVAYGASTQYVKGLDLGWSTRALNDTNPGATPTNTIINWNLPDQGGVTKQNNQPVNVRATQTTIPFPELTIPAMVPPVCGTTDYGAFKVPNTSVKQYLNPGIYTSITQDQWTEIVFNPGVYCIRANGNVNLASRHVTANDTHFYFLGKGSFSKTNTETLTMNRSSIYITDGDFIVSNGASITANKITIYVKKGNITISGNVPGVMTAPDCTDSACPPGIKGVLFLMDKTNTSGVLSISGSSSLTTEGTIFIPGSKIEISGYSGLYTFKSQIIAKRIEVKGSSAIRLDLAGANLYTGGGAGSVELLK